MKILSIGNSFSVDSQRWVRDIAAAGNENFELGDLYIGGCSLERHRENKMSGLPAYEYFRNNVSFGAASLRAGLLDEDWDVITLQQASHFSGVESTYFPYINELAEYVRSVVPGAKLYLNQTWAYEYNSTHPAFVNYDSNRFVMHERLTAAYKKAAESIGAEILPVGKAISLARSSELFDPERGGTPLTRDGFHLSYLLGRWVAGAVWYEKLSGKDIRKNTFLPLNYEYLGKNTFRPLPDSYPAAGQMELLRECVHTAVTEGI